MVHAARARVAALLAAVLPAALAVPPADAQVHSEFPALTRPFTTESYPRQAGELRERLADRGLTVEAATLGLARSGRGGGAGLDAAHGVAGGRLALQYRRGRYALSAEATGDGAGSLEADEYPLRLVAGAVCPEARLFAAVVPGFDAGGYAGTDLALEVAPVALALPAAGRFPLDLRPRLVPAARLRLPSRGGDPSLTPSAALALDHAPGLASSLALAGSLRSEWRAGAAPRSAVLVQATFVAGSWPLRGDGGVVRRGARPAAGLLAALFVQVGYACPLDPRTPARLVVGLGTDLDAVGRAAWPTSG